MKRLRRAVLEATRARKALEAIRPCPANHPMSGEACLLVEDHEVVAGTRHRGRRVLGRPARVEWVEW